jgi:methionine synthase I (cobalamin-dependent)
MTGSPLIRELLSNGTVLLDGAWGTELRKRGPPVGETPDYLNLSHPDRVEAVARAYVDAGSRVVLTNTFRANRIALAQHPEVERVAEVNRAGVEISRRAADGRAHVFASMGPSGRLLLTGKVSETQLREAFAEQARAQAEAGADGIVVETMTDLTEARIAVEAAKATGLPVVACVVFDTGKQRDRTVMGVRPEQAAEELTRFGADVVGANCGTGIEDLIVICASMSSATHLLRAMSSTPATRSSSPSTCRPCWMRARASWVAAAAPARTTSPPWVGSSGSGIDGPDGGPSPRRGG